MQKNDEDLVFVFKSNNNMDHSATNSRNSDEKELPSGVQDDDINTMRHILSKSVCNGMDRVAAEVLQGRMKRNEKKWKAADDPETLVSDNKIDEHLYNLCVDLVDTTISTNGSKVDHKCVSNSKQEQDGLTSRSETVTKRIKFKEFDDTDPYELNNNPTDKFYILENNNVLDLDLPNVPRLKHTKFSQKENLKTQSLIYPKKKKHLTQQSQSFNMSKSRKNAKNDFLNTIKRELQNHDIIEEPRNMFEALKVKARNKIKYNKHIHFDNTTHIKTGKDSNDPDCEFNSPKLIQTKKLNRNGLKGNKFADRSPMQKRRIEKPRN
ncbi:unnamed protein product [Parnassius apollo]|uniref:(apollo) hypothetical protein n=1 Tax=Parnassius apollo TaxID=110799 RepID=A0A8S3X465_PARAO|nr:unnamed protein product [Parnassius apollo]